MKLSSDQKKWIAWLITVVVMTAISIAFGVTYPVPPMPELVLPLGVTNFDDITIGEADETDTTLLFDGNAQDFYISLDDSADDLLIGLGSAVGTTPAISIDENLASTFAGATTFAGDASFTGAATVGGDLIVDDTLSVDETSGAIASTGTLTPTTTYYQVAPATGIMSITLATGVATDGDLLIIHNTSSTSTVIEDTGATAGGGAVTLGANDLGVFIFGNTKWIEIASGDNS